MQKQTEWVGPRLAWLGFLVCDRCLDQPQPQLRPIRLPPDPIPVKNPRPEAFATLDNLFGFTAYTMWAGGFPLDYETTLTDGNGNPILANGVPIIIDIGHTGIDLLAQLAQMTSIPIPGTIRDESGSIAAAGVSQQIAAANASRSYIAIFNPCSAPLAVSLGGPASVGAYPSINIGEGGCLFWATAQKGIQPYTGAIFAANQWGALPFYLYEAP